MRNRFLAPAWIAAAVSILAFSTSTGTPCEMTCPAIGWGWEGEPACHDNYDDVYNGGCKTETFQYLAPESETVRMCGESGTFLYNGLAYRDTDWYEIRPRAAGTIDVHCEAEFPVLVMLLDGRQGCAGMTTMEFASAGPCQPPASLSVDLDPGTYWIWVAPSVFSGVPCGSRYRLWIDGYRPNATDAPELGEDAVALRLTVLPNPSRELTRIAYDLPRPGPVHLVVVDVAGRIVRTLRDGATEGSGSRVATWDGRDDTGRPVPSGVYALRLECEVGKATETVVWLR